MHRHVPKVGSQAGKYPNIFASSQTTRMHEKEGNAIKMNPPKADAEIQPLDINHTSSKIHTEEQKKLPQENGMENTLRDIKEKENNSKIVAESPAKPNSAKPMAANDASKNENASSQKKCHNIESDCIRVMDAAKIQFQQKNFVGAQRMFSTVAECKDAPLFLRLKSYYNVAVVSRQVIHFIFFLINIL